MPETLDHVAYLSQEIGARPAGTEEEQQAALYITEQMQKEAGLSAVIEDFRGAASAKTSLVICCVAALIITVLALFLPVLGAAAIVVTLLGAVLFAAEVFDRPILSKAFSRGISQNVVAKFEPPYSPEAGGTRRRKVVLIARYDSGKVRSELSKPVLTMLPGLQWATLVTMVLLPILLILRYALFLNARGSVVMVLNVLIVISLILVALFLLVALLYKLAAYNEGANCNASGVAVLIDIARRVSRSRSYETEGVAPDEVLIHGEGAARAAGLVPEGAQLVYEAANMKPPELEPQSPEMRLVAAKAAIAALSGKPISGITATDIAQNLVKVKESPLTQSQAEDQFEMRSETREALGSIPPDTMMTALEHAEERSQDGESPNLVVGPEGRDTSGSYGSSVVAGQSTVAAQRGEAGAGDVPDWFKKAQEKAKKQSSVEKPVQRSRYASALDAASAAAESAGHFTETNTAVEQRFKQRLYKDAAAAQEMQASEQTTVPNPQESFVPEHDDPLATTSMPPIDVTDLAREASNEPAPLPTFLDVRKTQEEARRARYEQLRTDNRIEVTRTSDEESAHRGYSSMPDDLSDRPESHTYASQGGHVDRRPIVLPDIGLSHPNLTPIAELPKQRAPLAEAGASGKIAAKSLLTMLPSIEVDASHPTADGADSLVSDLSSADGQFATDTKTSGVAEKASLRSKLPSLSGAIREDGTTATKRSNVNAAGSFVPAGNTGTFAPVGDELLENVDPSDIYVDDADDSDYEAGYTETGAFAGPGYVEMPKSRAHRLFSRFRRKNKEEETTPQEWLDVDESFEARTVGAERGGWESFREEGDNSPYFSIEFDEDIQNDGDDNDDLDADRRQQWQGGAFSLRRRERDNTTDDVDDSPEEFSEDDFERETPADSGLDDEIKQVYQFRDSTINTEVWFVALGSELVNNSGMRAFLAEHQQDLRGAVIVELDAMGAGDLSIIENEGKYRSVKTSSRMKRYVKKAAQATGLHVGSAQILWETGSAAYVNQRGYQAMHLAGMRGAKQAYYAQGDDVFENIDEETIYTNEEFVMELLKII